MFLNFDETQTDGSESGGYAAPSSPEFREKQLEKFAQLAPNIDIVITTALIPGRPAPKLVSAKAHRPAYGGDGDYFSKPSADDIFEAAYAIMHEANPSAFPTY